jgi:hypothetical protein
MPAILTENKAFLFFMHSLYSWTHDFAAAHPNITLQVIIIVVMLLGLTISVFANRRIDLDPFGGIDNNLNYGKYKSQ